MKKGFITKKFDAFVKEQGENLSELTKDSPKLSELLNEFLFDLGSSIGNKFLSSLSIFETLSEGVCILDDRGFVTYCSPTASRLLGRSSSEVLGEDFIKSFCSETLKVCDENCIAGGVRVWFDQPEGIRIPVLIKCGPLFNNDNSIEGRILTISDISSEIEKERILEKSRDDAILLSERKSNFLAMVSHEIRTPINGISSLATLLGMYEDLPEEVKEDILDLEMSAQSLSLIVNTILDFSKLEANKLFKDSRPTTTNLMFKDIEIEHRALFKSKNQYFFLHFDETLPKLIHVDSFRLKQVVSNLLSNANKFTSVNGCVIMYVRGRRNASGEFFLEISVADTGIGINESKLNNIFESYSQLDNSITRSYGGTGLGLAICKKLADLLDGTIEVKSRTGIGSIFNLVIPVEVLDTASMSQLVKIERKPEVTKNRGTRKILAIDDNKINLLTLTRLLQARGHEVVAVSDPCKVKDIIGGAEFDLILTDIHMPIMSGDELARNIREELGEASPPIVAITADNNPLFMSTNEGVFDDVLLKPIDFVGLYRVIDSIN